MTWTQEEERTAAKLYDAYAGALTRGGIAVNSWEEVRFDRRHFEGWIEVARVTIEEKDLNNYD